MSGIGIASQASSQRSRRPLLSSCALAAAMVALGHSPALAQSFNGSGTVVLGTAGIDNSMPGQTTINVGGSAIINWTPNDTATGGAPINFQDAGTTTTFNGPGSGYTVLNRILPGGSAVGRPVQLNGTIQSNAGSGRGGAIWFYSPDGLIIGSTASINVGSLLLTTRAISNSDFTTGNGTGVYNFGSADNSRAAITIQPGAMIDAQHDSALGISSYVAMVAPRIKQGGNVRVDGSAAYVAAEQATITINNGLFGIEVQSGSAVDAGTPGDNVTLEHTGSTGGAASSGDARAIYMVAIPKNVAVTMLVGGNVGYDAGGASVQNGVVVLSAGSNLDNAGLMTNGPASGIGASATITGGTFTSNTTVLARTDATAQGNLTVAGNLSLSGGRNAILAARAGETIGIGGALNVATSNRDAAGSPIRGTAAIDIGTNADLAVSGSTAVEASVEDNGTVRGGFARVSAASGGTFDTQSLRIAADATGLTGNGLGGDATLSLTNATLTTGTMTVSARGLGGIGQNGTNGTGGTASVTVDNTTLNVTDGLFISASGEGGGASNGGIGGIGTGGNASFTATGAATNVAAQGGLNINAEGIGGGIGGESNNINGINAGDGRGGTATYNQSGGTVMAGELVVGASGSGGSGIRSADPGLRGGNGGAGVGGTATAILSGGALDVNGVYIEGGGRGGSGGEGQEALDEFGYGTGTGPDGGDAGSATGGTASFTVGGTVLASTILIDASGAAGTAGSSVFGTTGLAANASGGGASGTGGATLSFTGNGTATPTNVTIIAAAVASVGSGDGGNAYGGKASITKSGTGDVSIEGSTVDVSARAGDASADGAVAGTAVAGSASLLVTGGTLTTGSLNLLLDGLAGSNMLGTGGNATGGTVNLNVSGAALDLGQLLVINTDATGGTGITGGSGQGGSIDLLVGPGGSFINGNNSLTLSANGTGGNSLRVGPDEVAGAGMGGTITLATTDADLNIAGDLQLSASGSGGSSAGTGGAATGGNIALTVDGGGSLDVAGSLSMNAGGNGGNGVNGGTANGGAITLGLAGNADLSVNGDLQAYATASGGFGAYSGAGGAATGGTIAMDIAASSDGTLVEIGYGLTLDAFGSGGGTDFGSFSGIGSGGSGAIGTGGSVTVRTASGTLNVGDTRINASGGGGRTVTFDGSPTGNAGSGIGGDILFDTSAATITLGQLAMDATGTGGIAAETGYGSGGDGGNGTGGTARLIVGTGSLDATALSVVAGGFGGNGGNFNGAIVPGGKGGDGTGGLASITVNGGALTANNTSLFANARGGTGGFSNVEPAGAGGDATGGAATIDIMAGGSLTSPNILASVVADGGYGGFVVNAQATDARNANGGNATGGQAGISLTDGTITASTARIDAQAYGGAAVTLPSDDAPAKGGSATGGTAELILNAGNAVFDDLTVTALANARSDGFIETGNAQGGTARVTTSGGSLAINQSLELTGGAKGGVGGGTAPTIIGGTAAFEASNGTTIAFGPASLTIDASARMVQGEEGSLGATLFAVTPLPAAPGTVIGGNASLSLDGVTLNLAGDLQLNGNADGGAPGTSAQGGSATLAVSNGGALTVAGLTALTASGIAVDDDIGGVGQGGTVTLRADGGTITAGQIALDANGTGGASFSGPGGAAAGGDILVDVRTSADQAGSITATTLTATVTGTGGTNFGSAGGNGGNATGGTITLAGNGTTTLANGIALTAFGQGGTSSGGGSAGAGSGGDILFDGGSANVTGSATVRAGGDIRMQAGSSVRSTANTTFDAGGNIHLLNGSSVQSDAGIAFTAGTGANGEILLDGGSADAAGFVTMRAGRDIRLLAASSVLSDSGINLDAGNDILIGGAVSLANAASDASVELNATNNIRVDTASGSITLTDQGGGLGGRLVMNAGTIFVGTQQAWSDISNLSNVDAIDLRLGANDGINNPQGFLRANAMEFRVRNALYIQNSGTNRRPSGQRAGFTVGAGGATIVNVNSTGAPIQIVINGRQARNDGTFATGKDLIPLLTISGSSSANANVTASFDPRSTVNGCLIMGDTCRSDTPPSVGLPQQDVIAAISKEDEDFDGETSLVQSLNAPVIQFAELTGLSTAPVIEQPVTGAGNEGLWLDFGREDAGDVRDQVTGTRKDDTDQGDQNNDSIDQPVTGTRNENLDQPAEPKP